MDMIDEKKVEEAASKLYDYGSVYNSEYRIDGFKKGVKWAIQKFLKDLWHDSKKEPEDNRNILIEHKCGDLHYYTEIL